MDPKFRFGAFPPDNRDYDCSFIIRLFCSTGENLVLIMPGTGGKQKEKAPKEGQAQDEDDTPGHFTVAQTK
ncbi:hypothetical protein RvY_10079 [Ramazzottius varieornatus]|uniref:Uncharacterized protein n=1 Tax=Ramazzottius varieornatus TaxID=947166 RepID=A0A1D1VKK4_RAMVA|nr:hypothetical protein RvY_10079 [Ramazzottius varieornatus]